MPQLDQSLCPSGSRMATKVDGQHVSLDAPKMTKLVREQVVCVNLPGYWALVYQVRVWARIVEFINLSLDCLRFCREILKGEIKRQDTVIEISRLWARIIIKCA